MLKVNFKMATREVKHIYKEAYYGKFSNEDGEILRYSGLILPADKVHVVTCMTNVMKDLTATTFYVPIIRLYSTVALKLHLVIL